MLFYVMLYAVDMYSILIVQVLFKKMNSMTLEPYAVFLNISSTINITYYLWFSDSGYGFIFSFESFHPFLHFIGLSYIVIFKCYWLNGLWLAGYICNRNEELNFLVWLFVWNIVDFINIISNIQIMWNTKQK